MPWPSGLYRFHGNLPFSSISHLYSSLILQIVSLILPLSLCTCHSLCLENPFHMYISCLSQL